MRGADSYFLRDRQFIPPAIDRASGCVKGAGKAQSLTEFYVNTEASTSTGHTNPSLLFDLPGRIACQRCKILNPRMEPAPQTATEPPVRLDREFIRDHRVKVLRRLRPLKISGMKANPVS